jgi:predicted DNA binding CopG/RHH family protein
VQVIGEKAKKLMSKQIQYSNEPIGEFRLVTDFLPSPSELALKNQNTKITISLSSDSLAYFKDVAETHHMQYQKIIRQLLDEYVKNQRKMLTKKTS